MTRNRYPHDFPIGNLVTPEALEKNPYEVYRQLRQSEPVSFIAAQQMYFVTRYDCCKQILADAENFRVGYERSTVHDIFGDHMMSVDGDEARHMKNPHRGQFMRQTIIDELEARITANADRLIDGFISNGDVDIRQKFASRLPILTMLDVFGLPPTDEEIFRNWYDDFEHALANTGWDEDTRQAGKRSVSQFHNHMQAAIDRAREQNAPPSLLTKLLGDAPEKRLSDKDIRHNMLIIMFGGISTVEALILNAIYGLSTQPDIFDRVKADHSLIPAVIEETVRWKGPVQSAHRYVQNETKIGGIILPQGAIVSCVLASANHDESYFKNPEDFDIDRDNRRHIAFASGPHICLGLHLARAQGRIALERLLTRLVGFHMDAQNSGKPVGSEFHQPEKLQAVWNPVL